MKTLYRLFYRVTIKDYLKVMESARMTSKMINESTYGKMTHFYDSSGKQIRGFHKHIKFSHNSETHPLIKQYN